MAKYDESSPEKALLERETTRRRQILSDASPFQGDLTVGPLLEALTEGVVVINRSRTIVLVNAASERMFGYQRRDLIGKPHALLIPERFREVHERHVADYMAAPKTRPMGHLLDLAARRQDGSEFPVEISLTFMETSDDLFVLAFVNDITQRKEYESLLREKEEQFRLQVESIHDYAIFMLDPTGKVLNWNKGAERLMGYREEEVVGSHFSFLHAEEDRAAATHEKMLERALAEGQIEVEGWRVRKDGSRFRAEVVFAAIRGEKGKVRGFSKVIHDVTERNRTEEKLRASNEALELSNRELDLFASVTSHDLQEPLHTVTRYAELLAYNYQGKLDQVAESYIHFIVDGTSYMHTLIDALLAYSRLGTRAKPFARVRLDSVVDKALDQLRGAIEDSGATIEHGSLPEVEGDAVQLVLLFQNLIANALKFRRKGVPIQVRISAERKGNLWVIGIHDNGIGIKPDYFESIFEVFRRLHTRGEYEGSGMGLAICRKIVDRHGGRIWVESIFGGGASFYFTLPVKGANHGR